jgi:hypothetical protein
MKDIRATGETELAFVLTATSEEFDAAKKSGALSGSYVSFPDRVAMVKPKRRPSE